jgi:hypothetical protein
MVRQDNKRSCWTSPKGHHNRWSLKAFVANQAVAFDKSMLMACPHLGDVLRPGLILDHEQPGSYRFVLLISNDKRAAVQEIEDMIMLFAAANGGRSPWRKVNVNALRRPSSNYPI